ncbi:MAG TPA: FtsX-like permease family protein [Candidatus Limnocylindrales bacterium]|nr:FtsX-like permease family protein [Candidatus Limnocylindrales bacterium]
MAMLGLWLLRLRDEGAATLGLVSLVLVTALCVSLGPRLLEQRSDDALRTELAAAPSFERTMIVYEHARALAQPLAEFEDMIAAAGQLEDQLPPEVRRLVESRSALVETPLWEAHAGTGLASVVRLRVQDGIFERIRLTSGRLPSGPPSVAPDDRPIARPDQFAYAYEALLPDSAAREMGVGPGSRLALGAWLNDQLNVGVNLGAALTIVGTYELAEPGADYWINDATVGGWRLHTVGTNDWLETTALLAPDSYRTLTGTARGEKMPLLYQYRFFNDTDRLTATDVRPTIAALRRIEAAVPRTGISPIPSDTRLSSGMLRLLESHQRAWQAAAAVLAVLGLGVLAIATSTLAAVAIVASGGRRHVGALIRARGGSGRQLLAAAGVEALLLCLPPALLGLALAVAFAPRAAGLDGYALAAVVAVLAALIVLAVAARSAPGGQGGTSRLRSGRRTSARRLVGELSLVVGALGAAWLLRERGINALAGDAAAGPDPLIAAVLALVGLAAGVVALRLYPLPARLAGWLVAQRRDLLPVLAVRRAVRGGSSAAVLLLLVATATVGAFASAALAHIEDGARLTAWHEVGAEYRISSTTGLLPADLEAMRLPGVEMAAAASLRSVGTDRGTAWLVSIEPSQLGIVTAGTPAHIALPGEMLAGGSPDVLPAVVGGLGVRAGETFELTVNQRRLRVRASQVQPSFPGVPVGSAFVALAADQLAGAVPGGVPRPSMVLLRGQPGAAADLRAAVATVAPWLVVVSRAETEAARMGAPVMDALRALIALSAVLALAYAGLAVGAALVLAASAQRDETAHLRAIGLGRRGTAWLSLLEHGPAALAGYLIGAALGLALFAFIVPALGLAAIVGSTVALPVGFETSHLLALLGAVLLILLIGWLIGVVAQRDTNPATAIRRGIE